MPELSRLLQHSETSLKLNMLPSESTGPLTEGLRSIPHRAPSEKSSIIGAAANEAASIANAAAVRSERGGAESAVVTTEGGLGEASGTRAAALDLPCGTPRKTKL